MAGEPYGSSSSSAAHSRERHHEARVAQGLGENGADPLRRLVIVAQARGELLDHAHRREPAPREAAVDSALHALAHGQERGGHDDRGERDGKGRGVVLDGCEETRQPDHETGEGKAEQSADHAVDDACG